MYFIENPSEYLSSWIFYLNSHTNPLSSRPFQGLGSMKPLVLINDLTLIVRLGCLWPKRLLHVTLTRVAFKWLSPHEPCGFKNVCVDMRPQSTSSRSSMFMTLKRSLRAKKLRSAITTILLYWTPPPWS